ncbi:hypothetical protein CSB45_01885 [candidate division KSB3 bacterium]|uniref:Uncharacterized protein n=1 Tax=candidate division KSB3 bacterium TaxID=2044937 RepID=A0A2G6E9L5_9BACT|nr:MAG: hypothetical protein CSB45_01885 [candidate division KSB3 bacterium]
MNIFDLSLCGYSYDYALRLLSALGNEGRKEYLSRQFPLDFIYPALFSIFSILLLAWLFLKRHAYVLFQRRVVCSFCACSHLPDELRLEERCETFASRADADFRFAHVATVGTTAMQVFLEKNTNKLLTEERRSCICSKGSGNTQKKLLFGVTFFE